MKPELPGVGGGEGVGVVRETGEGVTSVRSGDWVIPAGPSLGTYVLLNEVSCSVYLHAIILAIKD